MVLLQANCLNITKQSQTGSKSLNMAIYRCDVLNTNNKIEAYVVSGCITMRLDIYSLIWSIFIHISGCGHCKAMKPAYMEAAQELHNKNVCIQITQLAGGKITFPNISICKASA